MFGYEEIMSPGQFFPQGGWVWLFGQEGSLKIYRASFEDEAEKVAERISALTGLPRTQPPSQEISTRKSIMIVASALLRPILMLGLFLIIRGML